MDLGLRNRVAIVCAASQGLGKATAIGLAHEGTAVVVCSRDLGRITSAADEIRALAPGTRVLPVVADVTNPEHVSSLVDKTIAEFGRLDVLVTNAGGPPVGSFQDLSDEQWERGFALNLLSTIRLIRNCVPHMRKQHWGRIVNITSVAAKQPIPDLVISSTVRPGVLGLSKVLATQLAADGILVNTVAPGFFLTARQKEISASRALARGISLESYLQELSKDNPLGRLGEPEELANMIVFLASERASFVNGTVIAVDGGSTKGLW